MPATGLQVNRASYEALPYFNCLVPQAHPDRMATLALLCGLRPPPVERCRVLELGCADGANLIAAAQALPDGEFTGVDFSSRSIGEGLEVVHGAALRNVTLIHSRIEDLNLNEGSFDYIIAHGIYSWVDETVRRKLLEIYRDHLSAGGVGYISYNTYPGWYLRRGFREMMMHHVRSATEATARVKGARGFIEVLARGCPNPDDPYHRLVRDFREAIGKSPDFYIAHDHMEEVNEPVCFHEFAEQIGRYGLRFAIEADYPAGNTLNESDLAALLGAKAGDPIEEEQYKDFLLNRMFRRSLIVHAGATPDRVIRPERLVRLFFSTRAQPIAVSQQAGGERGFRAPDSTTVTMAEPLCRTAMEWLCEIQPRVVSFAELAATARHRVSGLGGTPPTEPGAEETLLATELLKVFRQSDRVLRLHSHMPRMVLEPGERPVASALARHMAQRFESVVNLQHEQISMGHLNRHLLGLLDGSRDRAALQQELEAWINSGVLGPVDSPANVKQTVEANLEPTLRSMARLVLLVR